MQSEGGGNVLFRGKAEFFDPLPDFSVTGAALGLEGGAHFLIGELAARDHEKAERNPVGRWRRRGHGAQTREVADEGGFQAPGLAIENALQEGATRAVTLPETLPEGLRSAACERTSGIGGFELAALEPAGEPD